MPGLMQQPSARDAAGAAPPSAPSTPQKPGSIQNAVLKQLVAEMDAKMASMPPTVQQGYKQILAAGLTLLYSATSHQLELKRMLQIKTAADVPTIVAQGVTDAMLTIYRESQKKMSIPASIPAAITLSCYVLEDVEQLKKIPVDAAMAAKTTTLLTQRLYQAYKISPQQIQQVVQQGAQAQQRGAAPGASPAPAAAPQGA